MSRIASVVHATSNGTLSTNYTTGTSGTAGLTLDLGFSSDYLIVVGGGGGGGVGAGSGTILGGSGGSGVRPFAEDATIFALVNYSGAWNDGLFTYNGNVLADGSRFTAGSQVWGIDCNSSTGGDNFTSDYLPSSSFVTVMAVPEPATLTRVGIGATVTAIAIFRRPATAPLI